MFAFRGSRRRGRCACWLGLLVVGSAVGQDAPRAPRENLPTTRPAGSVVPITRAPRRPPVATAPAENAAARRTFIVLTVIDGETLRLAGESEPVHLAGVLVPPGDADAEQRAVEFLAALLEGESVYVEELSRIGRPIRRPGEPAAHGIWAILYRAPDGLCANIEAVRQGFARFDDDETLPRSDDFRAAERVARQAKKGIWNDGSRRPQAAVPAKPDKNRNAEPQTKSADGESQSGARRPAAKNTVYVTRTGTKYHTQECAHCRSGATPISLAEARERKLTPCSSCKPPE